MNQLALPAGRPAGYFPKMLGMPRGARSIFLLAASAAALLCFAATRSRNDVILYNPSQSMPVGFYRRVEAPMSRGAIVTVRARDVAFDYATLRDFTDEGDRFIKRVAGVSGDVVCAEGEHLILNGSLIATRVTHDRDGRMLPSWTGCHELSDEEFFLLGDSDDSFDARYWGVVTGAQIEGVWRPLF